MTGDKPENETGDETGGESGRHDVFTPEERSRVMARVKGKDTQPELKVRRLAHGLGYRFRLHRADLPGTPDLVFAGRAKVIFVHGCFWHGHSCARGSRKPKTRAEYWAAKIARNRERDARSQAELSQLGWDSLTLWECQLSDIDALAARLKAFLG